MNFRKSMLAAMCAAMMGGASLPSSAAVGVYFDIAPPAPRYEVVPAPREGYVWVQGYWTPQGHHHVWTRGHWERERHGYRYHEPRWVERDDHRWYFEHGRWDRAEREHADHQR